MEYQVFINFSMRVVAVLGVMIGLYVLLMWLKIWVTHQLNKNKGVAVIEYRDGKQHRYSFATIQQAAAFTIKCKAKGKSVAYIEVDGKLFGTNRRI